MAAIPEVDRVSDIVARLENTLDYDFTDKSLLWEALQSQGSYHVVRGIGLGGRRLTSEGNKRLALIGNATLREVCVRNMINAGWTLGTTQDTISQLTSLSNLARTGSTHAIGEFIQRGLSQQPGQGLGRQVMADTVQAIIGAIREDTGYEEQGLVHVLRRLALWSLNAS